MGEIINQPTYMRQRFLLSFIRQLNDGVTATDLQKLVFLHTMVGDSDYYEFVPYKFGAYSFQLKEDVDILLRDGFVNMDNTRIRVGSNSPKAASFRIVLERGNALVRRAYREYPYYAINSEIAEKLFSGKELERFNKERQIYTQTKQVLFTIGYEGKGIEAFINSLIQNDIRLLCDVRKNPLSRKFGFSKGKLEHITQTVGIKYVHIPGLGIESDKRCSLETPEDYKRLFEDYERTLPHRKNFLEEVYALLRTNTRIALMCFERDPLMCHRYVIKDYIVCTHRVKTVDI
jgi:uncharacterized protein YwgA